MAEPIFMVLALCAGLLSLFVAVALWPLTLCLVIWHYLGWFWALIVGLALALMADS